MSGASAGPSADASVTDILRPITVQELVRYLWEQGVLASAAAPAFAFGNDAITGLGSLGEETRGTLGWISTRRWKSDPTCSEAFRGTVLLGPSGAHGERVVQCADPKLAFVLAAAFCFPESTASDWRDASASTAGAAMVSASARLAPGVFLGGGVVIGDDVCIGPNTCLQHVTIGRGTVIGANCSIGGAGFGLVWSDSKGWLRFPHVGRVEIGEAVEIGSNTCIDRGALGSTVVRSGARVDNLVHVAHNVDIGSHAMIIAAAMIGGSTTIGEKAWLAPSTAVMNQLTIGAGALIGLGAVVVKSVAPGVTVVGNPARPLVPRSDG